MNRITGKVDGVDWKFNNYRQLRESDRVTFNSSSSRKSFDDVMSSFIIKEKKKKRIST